MKDIVHNRNADEEFAAEVEVNVCQQLARLSQEISIAEPDASLHSVVTVMEVAAWVRARRQQLVDIYVNINGNDANLRLAEAASRLDIL